MQPLLLLVLMLAPPLHSQTHCRLRLHHWKQRGGKPPESHPPPHRGGTRVREVWQPAPLLPSQWQQLEW